MKAMLHIAQATVDLRIIKCKVKPYRKGTLMND